MRDRPAGMSACSRVLRAAARLVLCLALVLLPIASVSAAHFESATAVAHGHDHSPKSSSPHGHKPLCHQTGACFGFVTPTVLGIAPVFAFRTLDILDMRVPASAAVHLLLRPPIAVARA